MTIRQELFFFALGAAAATELIGAFTRNDDLATTGLAAFCVAGLGGLVVALRTIRRQPTDTPGES